MTTQEKGYKIEFTYHIVNIKRANFTKIKIDYRNLHIT